ncbi:MAG: PEF-CTERM sorting domain-containing protein [ANME-2 cluster archaeon]|nr:PEF-CTERM sorting domain-containing protein [ANME-2 cluster archaeon]
MNKLIISALLIFGLVGMIGTAAADQINIFEPGTFSAGNNGAASGTAVISIQLVPGGSAVIKDLAVWGFNNVTGTTHNLTTAIAPLGSGSSNDIIVQYRERTPVPGGLFAPGPYMWTQDMGAQQKQAPTVYELLDVSIQASANALPGQTYQVQVTDDNGLPLTVQVTILTNTIPEFPTIALPIAAILGLMFIVSSRKKKE